MVESFLEALHFGLRADGDTYVGGPYGPLAADKTILRGHRGDNFLCGALGVEHEAVGVRGDEGIAVLRKPLKGGFADGGVDVLAFGDELRIVQTGRCGGHGRDGHGIPAGERAYFFQKLWTGDGKAARHEPERSGRNDKRLGDGGGEVHA